MSIERNMNDANLNINNSIYTNQGLNYMGVNNICNQNNNFNNLNVDKDTYSHQLIQGMKDMINKIDSKIENNEQFNFNNC